MARRPKYTLPGLVTAFLREGEAGVRAALRGGADVHERDTDGRSALHHAVIDGQAGLTQLLLAAGARAREADTFGRTPLHYAAAGHHADLAERLLAAGASVDPADAHGNTPLCDAVFGSKGRGDMIMLLLRHGADRKRENKHGVSPEKLAHTIANYDIKHWFGPTSA